MAAFDSCTCLPSTAVLARRDVHLASRDTRLDLVTDDHCLVSGWVKDARGLPLAGARVTLGRARTRSAADGRFELAATTAERELEVFAEGFAAVRRTIDPTRVGALQVRLRGTATLRGNVVGLQPGTRLAAHTKVLVWPVSATTPRIVSVDDRGRFECRDLRAGGARVRTVIGPLRAFMTTAAGRALSTARADVMLPDNVPVRIDVRLPPAAELPGHVEGRIELVDADVTASSSRRDGSS